MFLLRGNNDLFRVLKSRYVHSFLVTCIKPSIGTIGSTYIRYVPKLKITLKLSRYLETCNV